MKTDISFHHVGQKGHIEVVKKMMQDEREREEEEEKNETFRCLGIKNK